MVKEIQFNTNNFFRFENGFDIRNLQKSPPHHFPNPQGYRDTTN